MKIREFTSQDYPAMVAIHHSLDILWPERPRSAEAWAEKDRKLPSNDKLQRWVAEEDGQVVGYASYKQGPWEYPPHSFYINVPMQALFNKLGYARDPEWQQCQKDLSG